MDKEAVAKAIGVLRESGLRIPSSLQKRVSAVAGYEPKRADIKAFERRVTGLLPSQKLIVKVSNRGNLQVFSSEAYRRLIDNAANARKGKAAKEVVNGNT